MSNKNMTNDGTKHSPSNISSVPQPASPSRRNVVFGTGNDEGSSVTTMPFTRKGSGLFGTAGSNQSQRREVVSVPSASDDNVYDSFDSDADNVDDDEEEEEQLEEEYNSTSRRKSTPTDNWNAARKQQTPQQQQQQQQQQHRADLSGCLYKRRGGFGRNAEHNWVLRYFTLYGPVLCYYDSAPPSVPYSSSLSKSSSTAVPSITAAGSSGSASATSATMPADPNGTSYASDGAANTPPSSSPFDPSKPRGRLDLSKEDTVVETRRKKKPGCPTDLLLTVSLNVLGTKRKWELCCLDEEQLARWYDTLRKYDGPPLESEGKEKGGLGGGGKAEGKRDSPGPRTGRRFRPAKESSVSDATPKRMPTTPTLPATTTTTALPVAVVSSNVTNLAYRPTTTPREQVEDGVYHLSRQPPPSLHRTTSERKRKPPTTRELIADDAVFLVDARIIVAFGTFNAAAYVMRVGSLEVFLIAVLVANLSVLYIVVHLTGGAAYAAAVSSGGMVRFSLRNGKQQQEKEEGPTTPSIKQKRQRRKNKDVNSITATGSDVASTLSERQQQLLPAGSTMRRAPIIQGTKLADIVEKYGPMSKEAIREYASSAKGTSSINNNNDANESPSGHYDETIPHTYWNTDSSVFSLRIGPNYKKHRKKAPSGPALYNLIAMDFVRSDSTLPNATDGFILPSVPGVTDMQDTGNEYVKPLLVVNAWLPIDEPRVFGGGGGGGADGNSGPPSYVIVIYFGIAEWTLRELQKPQPTESSGGNGTDTMHPAVQLLIDWCRESETNFDMRSRFKCMGVIENIESITSVPSFIAGYNGKPTLVTKSGTFTRYAQHMEMTVNIHMWAYIARKGLYHLWPKFNDFVLNIGFTIEARKDYEMPEVLLGGVRVLHCVPDKVVGPEDVVVLDDGMEESGGSGGGKQQQGQHQQMTKAEHTDVTVVSTSGRREIRKRAETSDF